MCGIAGVVRPRTDAPVRESALRRMARALRHRGPDGFGMVLERGAGFVSARLAIVDRAGGWQPLESPGESLLVYNGEVFNHVELRRDLRRRGGSFATESDTEVVLALLEREGPSALERLEGQFALALWDPRERRLILARDRFGVAPLQYALADDGTLVFGSEAKALFASGEVSPSPDLEGLDDVFTSWGPRPPRTAFRGVRQLEPGGLLVWEDGEVVAERRWWSPERSPVGLPARDLEEVLRESVRLRLRADVPVGAYLSGGLDSSLLSALAQEELGGRLHTFSVAFTSSTFDESAHQRTVASALGTSHHVLEVGLHDIAAAFPDVVRHAETPLVRTAPAPLFLLSREVRRQGITVVLTGEGADELFWGYDLFKEVAIRELHESEPERALGLLDELYPYLGGAGRRGSAWRRFLLGTAPGADPLASHLTRIEATGTVRALYDDAVRAELGPGGSTARLRAALPEAFGELSPLERAAHLELTTLLSPYLLAAQGDRVAMAHGVEGRFPFLDRGVFGAAGALAPERKLAGARDKVALREVAAGVLPPQVAARPKQPYRAPEVAPFFGEGSPEWVRDLLAPAGLAESGVFDPRRVSGLERRCREGRVGGVRESMALVGVLSTGLWHRELVAAGPAAYPEETADPRVMIDRTLEPVEEAFA